MDTRLEIPQKTAATERLAANTQAAQHFALVPYADLPQLDARAEHTGKVLDKVTEVDGVRRP